MVVAALEHNLTPIIDATNLNKNTLAKWEVLADLHEAEIEYIKCIVPYEEALVRDKNRKRPVGEKVVTDFYNRYFPEMITKVEE
jgi:predicted kinase